MADSFYSTMSKNLLYVRGYQINIVTTTVTGIRKMAAGWILSEMVKESGSIRL